MTVIVSIPERGSQTRERGENPVLHLLLACWAFQAGQQEGQQTPAPGRVLGRAGVYPHQKTSPTLPDPGPEGQQQQAANRRVLIFLGALHWAGAGHGLAEGKQGFKATEEAVLRCK